MSATCALKVTLVTRQLSLIFLISFVLQATGVPKELLSPENALLEPTSMSMVPRKRLTVLRVPLDTTAPRDQPRHSDAPLVITVSQESPCRPPVQAATTAMRTTTTS